MPQKSSSKASVKCVKLDLFSLITIHPTVYFARGNSCMLPHACYSQHPLILTLKGPNSLFELANVRIIESCQKNINRKSEWK